MRPDYGCLVTGIQALQLNVSLLPLQRTLFDVQRLQDKAELSLNTELSAVRYYMDAAALHLPNSVGEIADRRHTVELLYCVQDVLPFVPETVGINTHGLRALYKYSIQTSQAIDDTLDKVIPVLFALLQIRDHHDMLFNNLTDIGISNCAAGLAEYLAFHTLRPWSSERRPKPSWWEALSDQVSRFFARNEGSAPDETVDHIYIPNAVSDAIWHYWSIATILYDWQSGIISLYQSCIAHAPP
ncbi:MAG: hypothetical protein Q9166_007961 [cf. Caloplaca sp. 2 TL-2023]